MIMLLLIKSHLKKTPKLFLKYSDGIFWYNSTPSQLVIVKHNLVKWCPELRNCNSSERWQDCDTSQVYPVILVRRASYYSSVSLHSKLIASGVIIMEFGSVLACLSHVDNSGWAAFLIHSKGIKEKAAWLSPSSELWLIWLFIIYAEDISDHIHVIC